MGKIRQLDEALSNMIAAGEVVENMASVIKELMENAIDAEADAIDIDLKASGLKMIRVTDNGTGMDKSDLHMAFKRHATSKIRTHHDLHHIGSLGFRGEALPSIASVSVLEIDSSTGEAPGKKLILRNGRIEKEEPGRALRGTAVTVKNLFYNTPARLKHLKSEQKELSLIVDYVNKIALSHPHIKFKLLNDGRTILNTQGDDNPLKVLHQIYSLDVIKSMLYFEGKNQYFSIRGYVSKPETTRSSRQHMMIFTNRRIIRNPRLNKAVKDAFDTYLPLHNYPILFLDITVDPLLIDVNIHPQKLEVKFSEQSALESLIRNTLRARLKEEDLVPKIHHTPKQESAHAPNEQTTFDFKDAPSFEKKISEKVKPYGDETPRASKSAVPKETQAPETSRFPYLEFIGQFMGTYLLFQNEEGLYLMDQHAAAERIRYEAYREAMAKDRVSQKLLLAPIELNLSSDEVIAFDTYQDTLVAFGLELEKKDATTLLLKKIPVWFMKNEEAAYAERMIRFIKDESDLSVRVMIDQLAKDLSCKHSIRANKYITREEAEKLKTDLKTCDNPFTCPHGRPTLISFSVSEIETMFKRINA